MKKNVTSPKTAERYGEIATLQKELQVSLEDLFELPETKETLADKLRAHCGNPNHVAHSTATADQRSEFAEMLARYKGMA